MIPSRSHAATAIAAGVFAACAAMSAGSFAQGVPVPDSGSLLRQIRPEPAPSPSANAPAARLGEPGAQAPASDAAFRVERIALTQLVGGKAEPMEPSPAVAAILRAAEGRDMTLGQLRELAARVTDDLRSRGFALDRAIIPAQSIEGGVVEIQVVQARFGKVEVENHSRAPTGLLARTLGPGLEGSRVTQEALDRSLLLLGDIPGVSPEATLRPGAQAGSSDISIDAQPTPSLYGQARADSFGNAYTGRARLGAGLYWQNPLALGDLASFNAIASDGLSYGRLGYEAVVSGSGARVGASASALRYRLGGSASALHAKGTADTAGVFVSQPLIRSRPLSLYGRLQYDWQKLSDRIDSTGLRDDRSTKAITAALSGDAADSMFGRFAATSFSGSVAAGRLGFSDDQARASDAMSARAQGRFTRWNGSVNRLQQLAPGWSAYASVSGQLASSNLDSSQKLTLGGAQGVRAYDSGAVSGDEGYSATVEARRDLGAAWRGQAQLIGFVDTARARVNKSPWAPGLNGATISGAGAALAWSGLEHWSLRATAAFPIGSTPALLPASARKARGWLEASLSF